MVKSFSQKFVVYHGCGAYYHDGTNKIVSKNRRCIRPTYEPFWKKPNDVHNNVEARAQLKLKSIVKNDYIRRYYNFYNKFQKQEYFSSDNEFTDDESSNNDSIHKESYNEPKTDNNTSNTRENLVIDESIASTIKLNDTKQSEPISSTQNPDNKNEAKN